MYYSGFLIIEIKLSQELEVTEVYDEITYAFIRSTPKPTATITLIMPQNVNLLKMRIKQQKLQMSKFLG